MTTRHTELAELAVGWVLHALEPDEEEAFLAHLGECVECEELVAETAATLSALARADDELAAAPLVHEPPPGLRAAILAAAGESSASPPTPPVPDVLATPAVRPTPAARAAPAPRPDRRAAGLHRLRAMTPRTGSRGDPGRRRRRLVAVAAGVAVLAVVGGLVGVTGLVRSEREQQAAASAAQTRAADAERVVSALADAGAPGSVHATLASPAGDYLGLVVFRGDVPSVVTTGVPANRGDQTYVLWGLAAGEKTAPVAIGTFDVGGSTPSVRSVPSEVEATPFAGYAVSLEPGRAAPASPTDVVASGQVGT